MFEKFLEKRNEQLHRKAAELLVFMGLKPEEVTAYEESRIIETVEKIIEEKGKTYCYPYYGEDEEPCYRCGDCVRQQSNQCQFVLESAYVFTFGTDKQFPFGIKDYVLVFATNEADALVKFRKKHTDITKGTVNCAFWYQAKEFFADGKHSDMNCCEILN